MISKRKKSSFLLPAAAAACLFLFLLFGGSYFAGYLRHQIFVERTTQLNELTGQVRENLDNALGAHWNYLTAAVNMLEGRAFSGEEDTVTAIQELERLLAADSYSSMLMLLDSQGNGYDAAGKHGVWTDIDLLSDGGEQYTFISDNIASQGSHWAFVQKLQMPIRIQNSGVILTHVILLTDVSFFVRYYDSAAYGSRNETYILKSNGTRMHDDMADGNTIQAYNVIKVLEEMEGQEISDIKAALAEQGTLSANFRLNGTEYYYCLTSLGEYDTLLLFLIPADFVASSTVDMVSAVIRMQMFLGMVLLVLMALYVSFIGKQRNSVRLFRQEQENLRRVEEMNLRLEATNAMLARSKAAAEDAFRIAEDANRGNSSFLSSMSHYILTPMNAIVGFATLLARDAENPERVMAYTKKITASSQHLLGLINDILDISKIEAGKTALNMSEESIVELTENIDSIIRPQMKAKGHVFEVYSKALKHEYVVMDKLRLNQILLNLLSNAVKYTPDGGRVTLTVEELPQTVSQRAGFRFIVEDNGYGMSEEYQQKIFQAFTREEDSVTNKIQGTGLGMAITKNLLDLMGGAISLESEKGKGSVFTVSLEFQTGEQVMDLDFWKNHGITRMLAVDDEEAVCQNIRLAMEGTGVTVDDCREGGEALDMIKRSLEERCPYQMILLDWKMPGPDGVETARLIRRSGSGDEPVIMLSGYDLPEVEEEARAAGVDGFLSKPFFLTSFRQRVEALLGENIGSAEKKEPAADQSSLRGMHILVAEDNEINSEILRELLRMSGATCDICENGRLAVEAFEKSVPGQYQVILMDVQMPVLNGYDATAAIRESVHPLALKIPIIAMTANAFAEDVRDALEAGMNGHVAKPVDMLVLEQTVRAVLEAQAEDGE